MAQLRAGKSSKSKLTIVKFKTPESVDGWEVHQGTYFRMWLLLSMMEEWMPSSNSLSPEMLFSPDMFSPEEGIELSKKLSLPLGRTLDWYAIFAFSNGSTN
ncbi:protein HIGH CHLOROPHYLL FLUORESCENCE PHENOTYPE 173, chloroplastic-like [Malus domestica]|uniref:protein HIGH CHLOROPHYLL FLUORESCENCE PHENOTYPE 173, chloroplastic-like n=1 Tax=Malus domestica TaxID=3750 RepID=UPI0010AB2B07|nr:uncharacterized protein LOC114825756 [Malus domestica]